MPFISTVNSFCSWNPAAIAVPAERADCSRFGSSSFQFLTKFILLDWVVKLKRIR